MRILSRLFVVAFLCGLFSIQAQAVQVTINSTVVNGWQYGGATATLRVYADQDFLTSSGEFIKAGNSQSSVGFYRSFVCNVSGVTLTIPTIANFPTTTDSQDVPGARFTFVFYDYRGVRRDVWMASIKIPHSAGSVLDWSLIRNYNHPPGPQPPPTYPSFDQMNAAINSAFSNIPSVAKATEANYGITKLNVPAANPADPKAVGPNDPLITGAAQVGGNNTFTGINSFISPKISSGIKDANGYTILGFSPTLSGAFTTSTYVSVSNGGPTVSLVATGPPTDINLQLSTKGAGSYILPGLGGAGTKCVHANNAGALSLAADDCGTGGGGSGTVTNTLGALPAGNMVIGNNGSDIKTQTGVSATSTGAIQLAQGTINTAIPAITISSTPAGAGQDFLGIYGNWTDNTSGGSTLTLLNLSVGSSPKITLDKSGNEFIAGYCPTCLKQPGSLMASNHTLDANDMGTMLTAQSGSALTLTINSNNVFAGDGGPVDVQNIGTADLTVHPSGVLIDGSGSDIIVAPGTGMRLFNVQSTWRTQRGGAGWAAGTGITLGGAAKPSIAIAATGVSAASYGDATHVPQLSINAQGQTTSAANVSIAIDATNVVSGAKQGLGTKFVTYVGSAPVNGNAAAFDANGSLVDSGLTPGGGGGGGSVTSVALSVPSTEFLVTGSPVVTAGTLAIAKNTINANLVAAGPTTGAAVVWGFRSLVKADQVATTPYTDQANTFGDFVNTFRAGADFVLADKNTPSKTAIFDLSNISSSTQRTINVPNANSTLAQAVSVVSNQFLTGMTAQGVFSQAQASFTNLAGSLACSQTPALSGDVTTSAGNCATTLANIPNDTSMVGDLLVTNSSAPGTPASGKTRVYVESGNKILSAKNDAGVVTNTAAPIALVSHQWLTSFGANGNFGQSQPAASDLSNGVTGTTLVVLQNAPTIINPTIANLGNLISNGFVTTSGSNGTLGVDTAVYTATTDVRIPLATGARQVFARKYVGATLGAQTAAADADLGASGGEVVVEVDGNQAFNSQVTAASGHIWRFTGSGTISSTIAANTPYILLSANTSIISDTYAVIFGEPSTTGAFDIIGTTPGNAGPTHNVKVVGLHLVGTGRAGDGIQSTVNLGNCIDCVYTNNFTENTAGHGVQAGGFSVNASPVNITNIAASGDALAPSVITTASPHGLSVGDRVRIVGVTTPIQINSFATTNDIVTNGTTTITSATIGFNANWTGQRINLFKNATAINDLRVIVSVTNSTTAVLNAAPSASASGVTGSIPLGNGSSWVVKSVPSSTTFTVEYAPTSASTCSSCTGTAARLDEARGVTITNNKFHRVSGSDLAIVNAKNVTISGNQSIGRKCAAQPYHDLEPNAVTDVMEQIIDQGNTIDATTSTCSSSSAISGIALGGGGALPEQILIDGNSFIGARIGNGTAASSTGGTQAGLGGLQDAIFITTGRDIQISNNLSIGAYGFFVEAATASPTERISIKNNRMIEQGNIRLLGVKFSEVSGNTYEFRNWTANPSYIVATPYATFFEDSASGYNKYEDNSGYNLSESTIQSTSKVLSNIASANNLDGTATSPTLQFPNGFNVATVAGSMVGINTSTPNFTLEVKQPGAGVGMNLLNTSNQRASLGFGLNAGVTSGWILGQDSGLNSTKDFFFYDVTAAAYRMKIDTSGNTTLAVQDKGGQLYNCKAYGAMGDGTTDDTAAIQTCLDAVPSSGGIAFLPAGLYKITSTLTIGNGSSSARSSTNYITFTGAGGGSTDAEFFPASGRERGATNLLWYGAAGGTMLDVRGPISNVTVEKIFFDAKGGTNAANTGLRTTHAMRSTFRQLAVEHHVGFSFINTAYTNTISGVVDGGNNNVWETISSLSAGAGGGGIQIGPATAGLPGSLDVAQNTYINCKFFNDAGGKGIELRYTDASVFINVTGGSLVVSPPSDNLAFPGGISFYNSAVNIDNTSGGSWAGTTPINFYPYPMGEGPPLPTVVWARGVTDTGFWFGTPNKYLNDVAITASGKGVIIRATDASTCHRITVNDANVISSATVTCP